MQYSAMTSACIRPVEVGAAGIARLWRTAGGAVTSLGCVPIVLFVRLFRAARAIDTRGSGLVLP